MGGKLLIIMGFFFGFVWKASFACFTCLVSYFVFKMLCCFIIREDICKNMFQKRGWKPPVGMLQSENIPPCFRKSLPTLSYNLFIFWGWGGGVDLAFYAPSDFQNLAVDYIPLVPHPSKRRRIYLPPCSPGPP